VIWASIGLGPPGEQVPKGEEGKRVLCTACPGRRIPIPNLGSEWMSRFIYVGPLG
jgi:hypothetical protein